MRALLDRRPLLHPEGPRLRVPFDAVSESTASRLVELGCVESAITRYGRTGDATEVLERAPIEWRISEHNHLVERAIDRRDRTVLEHVLDPTLGIGAQTCRDFAVRAERVDWEEGLDILIARGFIDASFEKRSLDRRLLDHATSPERVTELLDLGADPNATDERGRTALHLAVDRGNGDVEAARLLLAAGADPDRRNDDGATALDDVVHAARSDLTHVDPALLSLMARSGADLDREGAWTFSETLRAQLLDLTEDTELKAFLERRPQPARAR